MKLPMALGFALLATATMAGKPVAPSTTDPQVGYIKILRSGVRELRVSREDGTGSVVLAKASRSMSMALGPKSSRLIAYSTESDIRLLKYEVISTGLRTQSDVIIRAGRPAGALAFSPTGEHIAWNSGESTISLYDVAAGTTSLIPATQTMIGDVGFSSDGSRLIYSETISPTDTLNVRFKSVPITGGDSADLGIEGRYGNFGVGRTGDKLVADTMGSQEGPISVVTVAGNTDSITHGYFPSFRCDDRYVIFQRRNGAKADLSVIKHDLTTGLESVFSKSGNFWPEYFPDC